MIARKSSRLVLLATITLGTLGCSALPGASTPANTAPVASPARIIGPPALDLNAHFGTIALNAAPAGSGSRREKTPRMRMVPSAATMCP